MHELSIATVLVNTLLDYQRKHEKLTKILEVYVRIGKLRAISIEQLAYSYDLLVNGTSLAGSKLVFEEVPAKMNCPKCNFSDNFDMKGDSFHFAVPSLSCPRCETQLNLEGGDELQIAKIRVVGAVA
jgi:hydrogenase nickel incorporation protein HypA/HybF